MLFYFFYIYIAPTERFFFGTHFHAANAGGTLFLCRQQTVNPGSFIPKKQHIVLIRD